jgi:hypothetical protein
MTSPRLQRIESRARRTEVAGPVPFGEPLVNAGQHGARVRAPAAGREHVSKARSRPEFSFRARRVAGASQQFAFRAVQLGDVAAFERALRVSEALGNGREPESHGHRSPLLPGEQASQRRRAVRLIRRPSGLKVVDTDDCGGCACSSQAP